MGKTVDSLSSGSMKKGKISINHGKCILCLECVSALLYGVPQGSYCLVNCPEKNIFVYSIYFC